MAHSSATKSLNPVMGYGYRGSFLLTVKGILTMTYFARKGVVYNECGEAVVVITPISIDKSFTRGYAQAMADELNDTDNGEQVEGAV